MCRTSDDKNVVLVDEGSKPSACSDFLSDNKRGKKQGVGKHVDALLFH